MGWFIYSALSVIFGEGDMTSFSKTIDNIYQQMSSILTENELVGTLYVSLTAIAACLLLVYYGMEILSMVQRDMMSLEKLILMYIKLLVGFVLILCLKDILLKTISIGNNTQKMVAEYVQTAQQDRMQELDNAKHVYEFDFSAATNLGASGDETNANDRANASAYRQSNGILEGEGDGSGLDQTKWPAWEDVNGVFNQHYKGATVFIEHFGLAIMSIFFILIGFGKKVFVYFYLIGASANVIVRAIFSPIAVVNCFEGEMRSQGIRYLKTFVAGLLQYALIILAVAACDWITGKVLTTEFASEAQTTLITLKDLDKQITIGLAAKMIVAQVACIGIITRAPDIAADIMGTKPT